jgi:mRNA interferase MazF
LADAGRADWVLCQITSRSYTDPHAIKIEEADFVSGSLKLTSYARPGKLFTASSDLMVSRIGLLKKEKVEQIVDAVVNLLQAGL